MCISWNNKRFLILLMQGANMEMNFTKISSETVDRIYAAKYVGNSISNLQIQVATYVFELSAGKCHR